jgi:SAM-dependent methyltransferase
MLTSNCISVIAYDTSTHPVWQIPNSKDLTQIEAADEITNSCPIFWRHETIGDLFFTIVPYAPRTDFNPIAYLEHRALTSIYTTSRASRYDGKVSTERLASVKNEIIFSCLSVCRSVMALNPPLKAEDAVDLGCGIGCTSIFLRELGWRVQAFDNFAPAVRALKEKLPEGTTNFTVTQADISSPVFEVPSCDLAVAVDVLPYLPPDALIPLLYKIYNALNPGGTFIGSLFFDPHSLERSDIVELSKSLGAHFYENLHIAYSLLTHTGFEIISYFPREDDGKTPLCVEFTAKKQSPARA